MINLKSLDGYFYEEVPFTLLNATKVQNSVDKEYIMMLDNRFVDVLKTDIRSIYTMAVIIHEGKDNEWVACSTIDGVINNSSKLKIYKRTEYRTYENYEPLLYQSCLIRKNTVCEGLIAEYWSVAAYKGRDIECSNYPIFLGLCSKEVKYDYVPLNSFTEGLLGKNVSWKEYVVEELNFKRLKIKQEPKI